MVQQPLHQRGLVAALLEPALPQLGADLVGAHPVVANLCLRNGVGLRLGFRPLLCLGGGNGFGGDASLGDGLLLGQESIGGRQTLPCGPANYSVFVWWCGG